MTTNSADLMSEQIDCLREIKINPIIKSKIDSFIVNKASLFNGSIGWGRVGQITTSIGDDLDKLNTQLIQTYNIDKRSAGLYISLDKRLYHKLHFIHRKNISEGLKFTSDFDTPEYSNFVLTCEEFKNVYKNNMKNIIEFLEENVEVFPDNFVKYILNKKKERANINKIEGINNDFQRKIFANDLGDKPTKAKIEANLKFINNINDFEEKYSSLFYFHKVIREAEVRANLDKDAILNKISSYFYKLFLSTFGFGMSNPIAHLQKMIDFMSKDADFTDFIFKQTSNDDHFLHSKAIFTLLNSAMNQEQLDKLNKIILYKLEQDSVGRTVNLRFSSDEIKNTLLIEAKRQFVELNPDYIFKEPFLDNALSGF